VPLPEQTAQTGPRLIAAARAKPLSEVIGPLKLERISRFAPGASSSQTATHDRASSWRARVRVGVR
jgi:hypothetical protein